MERVKLGKRADLWLGLAAGFVVALFVRQPAPIVTAQETRQPFASSIEQRQQTVEELRKLNGLMQKQIDLLTSGKIRVIIVEEKAEPGKRRVE